MAVLILWALGCFSFLAAVIIAWGSASYEHAAVLVPLGLLFWCIAWGLAGGFHRWRHTA